MSGQLRMVHLRTVPDSWHARVLAARLGCEGIVTQLRGNVSGPYPIGEVSVLVEEDQAELAAELLLADEVESALAGADQPPEVVIGPKPRSRWRRAVAATAALLVAGAPLLAHFVS
jgi:hypothetical protein